MWIFVEHCVKKTSNALFTLVQTKQGCLKKLFKTVKTNTPELCVHRVMSSRPSDRQSKKYDGHMC